MSLRWALHSMKECRILVIEDHALVREAMVRALDRLGMQCSFAQASCGQEALAIVEAQKDFDLVLVDLMLPDMSGFSLLSVLAHRFPAIPVIVVSALADEASVKRALKAGASGFLPKTLSTEQLVGAVQTVLNGGVVTPELSEMSPQRLPRKRSVESISEQFGLTAAQTRVMELMVEGRTNREIAELLGLAEGTVKVHCSAILRALGVANRAQALVVLARQGLRG
ncbi:response regulator transcription factor [Uliginosibacterium sp. H3]|uniref:Response regulator transcription factor n=1 Tax=Uliginosibacterium silvisoli TaxID=3114758 RepID=A0ABU6JZ80_9RHOO|nr:response regulator transcription factor [Uliginosibacterium sp. H3]